MSMSLRLLVQKFRKVRCIIAGKTGKQAVAFGRKGEDMDFLMGKRRAAENGFLG